MLEALNRSKPLNARVWEKQAGEWYVEEAWCDERLMDAYDWSGGIWDPACGRGIILEAGRKKLIHVVGTDLVLRGSGLNHAGGVDFLAQKEMPPHTRHIMTNPPFEIADQFVIHALSLISEWSQAAFLYPTRRLNAARKWLKPLPLLDVLYLTPRPSMLPGDVYEEAVASGERIGGGKQDFCWLVFRKNYKGLRVFDWLHRDVDK